MDKKTWIILIAFTVAVALAGTLFFVFKPDTQEGSKTVTIIVVHGDKTEKKLTVKTDAEYLEQLLLDEGILKAEDDENGMYNTIDGEKADWNVDESWWRIYEGETESVRGVKEIPVLDGGVYKMVYTIGFDGF